MPKAPRVSLVVPCYDEEESIPSLVDTIGESLPAIGSAGEVEVVFVDDGSGDRTFELLSEAAAKHPEFRVIRLRRNFGQTAALACGIDHSRGEIIVAMDADLQNDPADIPAMLSRLEECDVVSGWRRDRQDGLLRRLPSNLANRLISRVSGVSLHDYGCTLKAYRRWVLEANTLYGEMHRFIPIYARWAGGRVAEMEVRHHPRRWGRSKYGIGRTYKVLLDLLTVTFLGGYSTKPIYFFGKPGIGLCGVGLLSALAFVLQFILKRTWVQPQTLSLLAVFLFTLGVQFLLLGLLAELQIRTYHEAQGKKTYIVRETRNLVDGAERNSERSRIHSGGAGPEAPPTH
ncbi:MAG: glycosyltransferase family 2 protein [Deltaproteobacteria bacterium]|nr:glycosyltransferase family 2 protein [Deltaproteobacteria bacterium]